MSYVIYEHWSPSGKVYVGQTCQKVNKRWGKDGKRYLEKRRDGSYVHSTLARAILKYGWDKLEHKIVHTCETREEANYTEVYLIAYYKSKNICYNFARGGQLGNPPILTEEEREASKLRKKELNKIWRAEHKEELAEKQKARIKEKGGADYYKEYYAAHKEARRESAKRYRRNHSEEVRERDRLRRKKRETNVNLPLQ